MEPRRTQTGLRALRRSVRVTLLVLAAALLLVGGWAVLVVVTLPDVDELAQAPPKTTAFMERYREERRGADQSAALQWRWVPYEGISPHLKRAVLVSEDINFFSHEGFDQEEIGNALREAWKERDVPRGASTITQQLARNLYLSPDKNALRKLKEAVLTRRLERRLSKRRILEIYLNVVEFGPGIYGAEAASWHYFGTIASELDEFQAAELAAVLPRPSTWHPGRETPGYRAAVDRILQRMEKAEFLWKLI